MLQYRVAPSGGVRDMDETKRQVLVSFPWEVMDSYNTDFERSCFDEQANAGQYPISCWQHIRSEPIGRAVQWQKTNTANELRVQLSDFDAVPRARQAFTQMRDGELTDWSYGFDNAKAVPHPNGERGALRFTKARMAEVSPVTVGSIPGATTVGVRAEADRAAIAELVRLKVISPEEGRRMLDLAGDVPSIEPPTDPEPEAEQPQEREQIVVQERADAPDADHDAGQLAQAVDAALDEATILLDGADRSALPDPVQQALSLVDAAGVAVDELLDAMGLDDPDEDTQRAADDGEERAPKPPYGDVAYADEKNKKYPIDTEEHARAAWSYINKPKNAAVYPLNGVTLESVKNKIMAACKKFGIDISAKREADDDLDLEATAALLDKLAG
jgi:HK97 family phage prohead protease